MRGKNLKDIYEAYIVYNVSFFKKRFLLSDVEYEGEIVIPFPNYILSFSERNARDQVVYSPFWQYDFAKQKLWEEYKIKDFEVEKKFVRINRVENRELNHLIENMDKKDFLEWLFREKEEDNA